MQPNRLARASTTRQRLLRAAGVVFAREGLAGATTRAIAAEARVNEVTLFRHFRSKGRLLAAVVGQNYGVDPAETLADRPAPTSDLHHDLLAHALYGEKLLKKNLPLMRTMIGEIHHHDREQEQQVYRGMFRPLKDSLVARLESAKAAGELAADLPATLLADLFAAMLFTAALREASGEVKREYSPEQYRRAAVELVIAGAATGFAESRR